MSNKLAIFDQLISESLPVLRKTAYGILRNEADADDAVQEALVRAWKGYSIFQSKAKLSSWVYRITVNVSYDILRKQKKEEEKLYALPVEEFKDDDASVLCGALRSAVARLPEIYRDAISAVYFSGLSGEQAADQLGCKVNALYWRISRAKDLLHAELKEI
ncbi:MAG: RNA polymerase sigma factor [Lentisphaeria bacterium]|nr:RNA polymerase sigma factor [Lentisphaeria bacterium]MBQ7404586.1 RNA polymerase sigma factor [Lentisphaeria bacterium]